MEELHRKKREPRSGIFTSLFSSGRGSSTEINWRISIRKATTRRMWLPSHKVEANRPHINKVANNVQSTCLFDGSGHMTEARDTRVVTQPSAKSSKGICVVTDNLCRSDDRDGKDQTHCSPNPCPKQ